MQRKVQVELNPAYKVNRFTRRLTILPWLREVDEISVVENSALILKYQWQRVNPDYHWGANTD